MEDMSEQFEVGQVNRLGNRQSNQDRFVVIERENALLAVLADGMGGRAKVELAAQAVIDSAQKLSDRYEKEIDNIPQFLNLIVQDAHQSILNLCIKKRLSFRPGTTGVLCYLSNGLMTVAHVGDSRCYHFRGEELVFRTNDHSFIQEMVSSGTLTASEASQHPKRHQITRCIGCQASDPMVDITMPIPLKKGDVTILCSDGLWASVTPQQMVKTLSKDAIDTATEKLAEAAEKRAYPQSDNISIVVVRYNGEDFSENSVEETHDSEGGHERSSGFDSALDLIQKMVKKYEHEITDKK